MRQPEALWNKNRVAEFLDLSVRQLERFIHNREIRIVKVGKSVRFDPVDVQAFIVHRKTKLAPLELKGYVALLQGEHNGDRG